MIHPTSKFDPSHKVYIHPILRDYLSPDMENVKSAKSMLV